MTVGFIGGGNMGEAVIAGIYKTHRVGIVELSYTRRAYLRRKYKCFSGSLVDVVKKSQIIILAVKPQNFDEVLSELSELPLENKLVVSIAAGITTKHIEKSLVQKVRVIRTMPNLPAKIGLGTTAISAGKLSTKNDVVKVRRLFDCVGQTVVVKENQMDAVTAVSGSGPAYVFKFVESMLKSSKQLGLDDSQAKKLVMGTLLGSAHLLESSKESASDLRVKVTSKGGTTQAALEVLTKKQFDRMIRDALKAAKARSKELSC